MEKLNITVRDFFEDNVSFCTFIDDPVKTSTSTELESYQCYSCEKDAIGSKLLIEKTIAQSPIQVCDIHVSGEFINNRGFIFSNYIL